MIVGCAMPEAEQGMNVARIGLLLAGLPNSVAGMTINRFCSSGLNAVSIAADRIRTGEADIMIAAGTESMSMIPLMGRLTPNLDVFARDENIGIAYGMGLTAEKVAERWHVSREDQDAFALASHTKALAAQAMPANSPPRFRRTRYTKTCRISRAEKSSPGVAQLDRDEGSARRTRAPRVSRSSSRYSRRRGSVTAGNSSQMSDGAGAVIVVSEKIVKELAPRRRSRAGSASRWLALPPK